MVDLPRKNLDSRGSGWVGLAELRDDGDYEVSLIDPCIRCNGSHKGKFIFKRLTYPNNQYTHWMPCPVNGEPILLHTIADVDRE